MTSNRLKMTNAKSISTSVEMANNEKIKVSEMGDVTIKLGHEYGGETLFLENVLYVPELDGNILSVGSIEERRNKVLFQNGKASVFGSNGGLILKSNRRGRIYTVEELKMAKVKSPSADIWHRRLGHIYKRDLQNVLNNNFEEDYESVNGEDTKLVERNQKDELKKEDEEGRSEAAIPRGYSGTDEETISVEKNLNNLERKEDEEQACEDEELRREDEEEGQNETIIPRRYSRIAARQKEDCRSAFQHGIIEHGSHQDEIPSSYEEALNMPNVQDWIKAMECEMSSLREHRRQRDPSTFSGDGNINPGQWLKEYERVSKYNRWDETMKLANVVFYLNGTAGRWFDNNEESLNSWRSFEDAFRGVFGLQEDSARRAEEVLKSRAQKAEESSELYIQEILSLCHQVNPRMEEGEIVAHIIKGISEDTYQVLVAKDIQTVDEILKFCRHLTTVKQRRIGRTKFARLSNVMPISCVDDSDDLAGLIRRIVREEIQKVFSAPEVINPLREVNALEQTVREEVSRALQPTRPQVNVVQQQPRTPYYNIDRPTQPRKTEHWRTYDDKPICFHCGRPGHVVRYCRERRQVFAEARTRNGGEGRNVGFSSRPPRYDADDDYVTPKTSTDELQETQLKSREWSQKINLTLDPGLSEIQRLQLVSCLDEFIDIFDFGSTPIKPTSTVKHKINTGDHSPIKQRPYRVAPSERRLIQDEVNKMIENHIVKPSESPWSSPVILVRKKDGTWRFCVDYRRLNKITKKKMFTRCHALTMPWTIEVDEKDREKTAFITPDGLYEFQVMPFGLCNAPATFERMIDSVLGSLKWNMCLCYLDDIVVYAPTFEEHLRRLQLVLSCIQKAGLSLNHKKCLFGSRRIKILGHLVDANGIHPDPDKVEAVSKFPRPRNISELRGFLGLCSYYRRFIENFADKARSLHDLLKTEKQFYWDAAQEKAFEVLKTALISEPVLGHFDESADTHLHTDANGHGIGAVLLQIQEKPFYKVGVDLLGRFPVSKDGNRWIIVCTDYMTRYAITKAIPDGGAIETAKFLFDDAILKHGAPREMITDRGRNFISQVIKEINALCEIVHRFTTAYHPQTNGLTERFNKTLGDMLSMYTGVEQKDWDQVLPYVTFAYNTAKQEATGYTPFFLVHAREAETYIDAVLPCLPDEISDDYVGELVTRAEEARQLSRSRLLQSQAKDRRLYDQKDTPVYYQKDDLVWIFTPIRKVGLSEKLLKRYFGPYMVTKKLSEVRYEVEPVDPSPRSRKSKDIVHVIRMKPYLDPEEQHSILLGNTGPPQVVNAIKWSEHLNPMFKNNMAFDSSLYYQFFGSSTGFLRLFPVLHGQICVQVSEKITPVDECFENSMALASDANIRYFVL
ncbi:K02A2.6-like [Cordylochernes scorpioides]|uniref:K02A2.6-like n=1 Tax=Cordylochernes scorpioides TaxID=51811 RepID=A0ABY6KG78_9ARAC|nr:K02A2.6-like [Cordylochernes scorpioides]